MYINPQPRPFPSHLFIGFSKRELQHTLQIVRYCSTSQSNDDTHRARTRAQTLLPCDTIVAAAGLLSAEGLDQDQTDGINISYATAPLQPRETDVLVWTEEGKPTWAIGRILDISKRTVRFP